MNLRLARPDRNSGSMNRRISIEKPGVPVTDGSGGVTFAWVSVAENVWANIRRLSAKRLLAFEHMNFTEAYQIQMRGNWQVTTECRLLFGEKSLTLHSVDYEDLDRTVITVIAFADSIAK